MASGKGRQVLLSFDPELLARSVVKKPKLSNHQKEIQAQVKEELLRVPHPKVDKYYPIYSDTPHAWQADLMFVRYTNSRNESYSVSLLNLVNINTRFAYSQPIDFKKASREEEAYGSRTKKDQGGAVMLKVKHKTAKQVLAAFKNILARMERDNQSELFKTHDVNMQVQTLYADKGGEFGGEFAQYCTDHKIHLVVFDPNEGSKRRLGIVERFNRTLRQLMSFQYLTNEKSKLRKLTIPQLLPQLLQIYNFQNKHLGVREFQRYAFGKEGKKDQMPKNFQATPFWMSWPGNEGHMVTYKQAKREMTEAHYAPIIKRLQSHKANIRFFLQNTDKPFIKSGVSNLSHSHPVSGRHVYQQGGTTQSGDAFQLEGTRKRVLPYDVIFR
jgi:hypothetical protein